MKAIYTLVALGLAAHAEGLVFTPMFLAAALACYSAALVLLAMLLTPRQA